VDGSAGEDAVGRRDGCAGCKASGVLAFASWVAERRASRAEGHRIWALGEDNLGEPYAGAEGMGILGLGQEVGKEQIHYQDGTVWKWWAGQTGRLG
jgi:hypothetical protein